MATLILEDGTRYEGTLFGHKAPVTGEVVFTTGMTGYQETLTDPSYCGQIVCMTYPLMGNVGINDIDSESAGVRMRGFIVSELCDTPSNWQMKKTLDQYLDEQGVTGLCGVDTRALTRHVREYGTLRGRIVEGEPTEADLALVRAHEMHDQVAQCTCKEAYDVQGDGAYTIAVLDFGLKRGILRSLHDGNERNLIVLTQPESYRKTLGRGVQFTAKWLKRKYPAMPKVLLERAKHYNETVCFCHRLAENKPQDTVLLQPEKSLNSFEKDVKKLEWGYEMGYNMTCARMEQIKNLFR